MRARPNFRPCVPNIHHLMSNRLARSNGSLNFARIVGPSTLTFGSTNLLLSALALFLTVVLHGHSVFHSLRDVDAASRLANINGHQNFTRCHRALPSKVSLTFVFNSLGNLGRVGSARNRRINSRLVHRTTRVVGGLANSVTMFHVNNSRFVVITGSTSRTRTRQLIGSLHTHCHSDNVDVTLNCVIYRAPVTGVSSMLSRMSGGVCTSGRQVCNQHRP